MAKKLTLKQAKFVASYQLTLNQTQSAINAGYPAKSAPSIGSQLLRNPKIIAELDAWKAKKAAEITKEDYIDLAIKDYKTLEVTEPNKPRFLDIAGKALGYIGANSGDQRPNQTLNMLNVNLTGKESREELLANVRRLLQEGENNG